MKWASPACPASQQSGRVTKNEKRLGKKKEGKKQDPFGDIYRSYKNQGVKYYPPTTHTQEKAAKPKSISTFHPFSC
jgi:hypothetical protein